MDRAAAHEQAVQSPLTPGEAMIELHGIRKYFGDNHVLDGVNLAIRRGETHIILGRSGIGKSVMLKLICGLMFPDRGSIVIDRQRMERGRGLRRRAALAKIQMLFQSSALFDSMSVAQNIAFHAIEHGQIKPSGVAGFAQPYLEMVDLPLAGPLTPAELSGGMRKRVALARALAAQPKIMLYDEPTTGLDPLTGEVINKLIRETQKRFGVTSVVVTHDLRSAQEVGDRCSFLEDGVILETTTPDQLSQSIYAVIRDFSAKAAVQA